MAAGAFLGHAVAPDRVADFYGWPRQRWYQREIGSFNAGLGYGVIAHALGRREQAFVESWAVSAILLGGTRAAALLRGERTGARNLSTVVADTVLGLGALHLLRRSTGGFPTESARAIGDRAVTHGRGIGAALGRLCAVTGAYRDSVQRRVAG